MKNFNEFIEEAQKYNGGYIELLLNNDDFIKGMLLLKKAYTEWYNDTKHNYPEELKKDIPQIRQDILIYLNEEMIKVDNFKSKVFLK